MIQVVKHFVEGQVDPVPPGELLESMSEFEQPLFWYLDTGG